MELTGLFFKPGRRSRAGAGGRTKPTPCQTVLFNVITAVFFYTLVNEPSKVKANVVFGVPPLISLCVELFGMDSTVHFSVPYRKHNYRDRNDVFKKSTLKFC